MSERGEWPARTRLLLLVLILLAAGAATLALLGDPRGESSPTGNSQQAASRRLEIADTVNAVRPALQATVPSGVTDELVERVGRVPGVEAAARVLLANVIVDAPGGPAQVSLAAVEPEEFRPLAPESTAEARFVWESLLSAESLITHEQFQILGGEAVQALPARGPEGAAVLQVAGLASNGIPNLAGVLTSVDQAARLGLETPTLLLVGLEQGAEAAAVTRALAEAVPEVGFEPTHEASGRTFLSGRAAQRAIGSFRFVANEDGSIDIDRRWVANHITTGDVPLIGEVACHRVLFPQLSKALQEIENLGLGELIKPEQYGGCYAPRFIERNQSNPLSMHAWGLAIDINVAENPSGERPVMDHRLVAIFEKWGFRWGGRWARPDGHHFELAALMEL